MRVLLVSDSKPVRGGVQLVCETLARQLTCLSHDVAILRPTLADPSYDYAAGSVAFDLDSSSRSALDYSISTTLLAFKPDVVHAVAARLPLANRIDALVRKIPGVLTVHNPPPEEATVACLYGYNRLHYIVRNLRYGPNALAFALMLRRWCVARVVCHSTAVAGRLRGLGCDAAKLLVVPFGLPEVIERAGVDEQEAPVFQADDFPRIATVSGIVHHKGLHDALHAVKGMLRQYPTLRYVIIGSVRDPGYAAYLTSVVRRLQLTRHVGVVSGADDRLRFDALQRADIYLQPSHEEGFCLAFLEAAMSTPRLVGTNAGEMPAIAGDDPLIQVVPRMNSDMLRLAMFAVLAAPASVETMRARRARLGRQYSRAGFGVRIASLYASVVLEEHTRKS